MDSQTCGLALRGWSAGGEKTAALRALQAPLMALTFAESTDVPFTDAYDWCTVPEQPWDVILFAGIAIVVSCVWQGSYQSLLVLISGECSCSDPRAEPHESC